MPEHDKIDNADAERRVRKLATNIGRTSPTAAVGGETRTASRKVDVIGLQRTVGNQKAFRTIGARRNHLPAAVSRKPDSGGGPLLVQRASFAELMSFWKKQELGQETPTPAPKKGNATPSLGPQVATTASAETEAMNPAIEEPKEAEKAAENSSPISATLSTGASARGSGTPFTSFKGGGSGTPFTSFHAKSGSGNALLTISNSVSVSQTSSSGGGGFNIASPSADVAGNKTKVKYLETEEARREFQLDINGTIKQGGQPYDTSKMYSKFKGDGFGIFVMGKDGRFFSTSHKIGLFHHSSFLGGGDVAGAGEMKVEGGELKYLTNKSGHYQPGDTELTQTIDALKKAGASGFSTAQLAQALPGNRWKDPYPGGVEGFLTDNPFSGGSGNKDVVKYGTKPLQSGQGYEDEKNDSLDHTRAIIRYFVGQAQLGKLRKFNKPNSDFGKSMDDLKALVLAEFGWSDEDTVTYAAVLENWNNDKTIGDVKGTPPMQMQSSAALTGSSWLNSSPVSATATGSGGSGGGGGSFVGSTSGRDWDEELQALLAKNPSPDWTTFGMSPYGGDFVIYDGGGGYRHPTAKDKVLLLTGEKTINEL